MSKMNLQNRLLGINRHDSYIECKVGVKQENTMNNHHKLDIIAMVFNFLLIFQCSIQNHKLYNPEIKGQI